MRCCSRGTPSCCCMANLRPATLAWSSICTSHTCHIRHRWCVRHTCISTLATFGRA
jgi:hypothetical protein